MDFLIRRIDRQRRSDIDEIAVEVGIVLVDPAQMGETIGVQRMQHQHANARAVDVGAEFVVAKQRDLAAGTAKSFGPMRARNDQHQTRRVGFAEGRQVDRQFLALCAAGSRMHVAGNARARGLRSRQKLGARFAVACREMRRRVHRDDAAVSSGNAASASAAR